MSKLLTELDINSLNKLLKAGSEAQLIKTLTRHTGVEKISEPKLKRLCIDLIEALSFSLVCLRKSGFLLTVETYNQSLQISNLVNFSTDSNLDIESRFKIKKYLRQLPGYEDVNNFNGLLQKSQRRSYDKVDSGVLYHEKVQEKIMFELPEVEPDEIPS